MVSEPRRTAHEHRSTWRGFLRDARPLVDAFNEAHRDPEAVQRRKLTALLHAARDTSFGRHHGFAAIGDYEDYAERVPIARWSELAPWIESTCAQGGGITSAEAPLFVEPTSGSSAARKLVPYTPALLGEFQRAILVWLAALFDACPAIAEGRAYWAMSPPLARGGTTAGGIPIGGDGDASYLAGSVALPLLGGVLDPPGLDVAGVDWRVATLAAMIDAEDLALISVWSPTFLLALLSLVTDPHGADRGRRVEALREAVSPRRRGALERALSSGDCAALWPRLAVISCWSDGPSERYASALAVHFPATSIVPKGLLATEGVVSFSWGTGRHCPLALDSHFLEFRDDADGVVLADRLEHGVRYRPLLTTGGGLYRYALGDIVECVDSADALVSVRYVGRDDARCDLVGEKLDEGLVGAALNGALAPGAGAMLVPDSAATPPRYVLLLDGESGPGAARTAAVVEAALRTIHHYAQARQLEQLGAVTPGLTRDVGVTLQSAWESSGARAGDCKPSALVTSLPLADAILRHLEVDGHVPR